MSTAIHGRYGYQGRPTRRGSRPRHRSRPSRRSSSPSTSFARVEGNPGVSLVGNGKQKPSPEPFRVFKVRVPVFGELGVHLRLDAHLQLCSCALAFFSHPAMEAPKERALCWSSWTRVKTETR